jgi:GR25 family glycosyltransferase involved in LPS biosynthesis
MRIKHLTITFSILLMSLSADFRNHLKAVPDKSGDHHMGNIDFIYLINLDERPEKYAHCIRELTPYGISPCRFSAVNGWHLTMQAVNELGVQYIPGRMHRGQMGTWYAIDGTGEPQHELIDLIPRNYFCHCLSRGAMGCLLSHLSVLQDAYRSGYETIWVLEDDIEIIRDPHLLPELINKLDAQVGKENWDVLYTDQDTKNGNGVYVPCLGYAWRPNFYPPDPYKFMKRVDVSEDFRRIGARYGTYSMIIRRSGVEKILNFFKRYKLFLPYDLDLIFAKDIQLYNLRDEVVSTLPRAASDNGAPNYLEKSTNP